MGAITALDASDILRSLVGLLPLTEDQRLTADVSGNGRVGTTDASLVLRYLAGMESSFPAGAFWQFRPTDLIVDLVEDRLQNFTAYMLGDVDGDWEGIGGAKLASSAPPGLGIVESRVERAGEARFVLEGTNLVDLRGGVIKIEYDPRSLEVDAVQSSPLLKEFMIVSNLDEAGAIQVAFAGAEAVNGKGPLFELSFLERGPVGSSTVLEVTSATVNTAALPPQSRGARSYSLGSAQIALETLIALSESELPNAHRLEGGFPNPFNNSIVLRYEIGSPGRVELDVFAVSGRRVRSLVSGRLVAGSYQIGWDGLDDGGTEVSTGLYLARLRVGAFAQSHKMLLVK